jgi:hypothetical protein
VYSPTIIARKIEGLGRQGIHPRSRSIPESIQIAGAIDELVDLEATSSRHGFRAADGSWKPTSRPLRIDEREFLDSETTLCRLDFRYFATRYGYCARDASEGGGPRPIRFWPTQERALKLIAEREERNHEEYREHHFSEGIRGVWHKTRQQGATALIRLISAHRMLFYRNTRCIAASLDETKVKGLYTADKVALDNLPHFLRPAILFDVKSEHIELSQLKSRLLYQQASQRAGVGTGDQFDVVHMTEVALWPTPERLQFDLLPAVPQSLSTFLGWESTANGRGNFWHEFTESIRHKEDGFERWIYVFTPWYLNRNKNRLIAPIDWSPDAKTLEHAKLVEETSHEFADATVHLSRDQLYWWESEYRANKKLGTLHLFLTNYPATPEQSFQTHRHPALPLETIEWMRTKATTPGMPYQVEVGPRNTDDAPRVTPSSSSSFPALFTVGESGRLLKMSPAEYDNDPRGIVWVWEPPSRGHTYGIGIDPSFGRTGWSRYTRVKEDRRINNSVIQVVRMGRYDEPDTQVCEYAAPVDAFEIGQIAAILGRIYAGSDDTDQCKVILEVFPGPGKMTARQLLEDGYVNLWRWEYYAEIKAEQAAQFGWHATNQTNRDLWSKASRHLILKNAVVRSPWLLTEFEDCRWNQDKQYGENPNDEKGHGDRVRAFNLAIWMLNGWSSNLERRKEEVRTTPRPEPACSDMSWTQVQDAWQESWERMCEE